MSVEIIPGPICWSEGMLLRPQHFQQAFSRVERTAAEAWRLLSPFSWGVLEMEIDPAELAAGRFTVRVLDAILPDGSRVQVAPPLAPLSLSLKPSVERYQREAQRIYLVLGANAEAHGLDARFVTVAGGDVPDLNTGDNPVPVERLRPAARLWDEGVPPAQFVSLPVAEVICGSNGFELSAGYVPPAPRVSPASRLGRLCGELIQLIRGRLAGGTRLGNAPEETRRQGALLVASLPAIELLLASGEAHPFPLYLTLAQMAGSLAGLREIAAPLDLDRYDHHDPLPCFESTIAEIRRSLDRYLPAALLSFPFISETSQFRLKAHPGWTGALDPRSGKQIVLGARAGAQVSPEAVTAWVARAAIGLRSAIAQLQDRRELGAERRPGASALRLRAESGEVLFCLSPNPESPEALRAAEEDLLVVPSSPDLPRPSSLVLYVLDAPPATPSE